MIYLKFLLNKIDYNSSLYNLYPHLLFRNGFKEIMSQN